MASNETVIVTGASHGIGAAVVQAFLGRGYNVLATSRSVSKAGFARLIPLFQVCLDVVARCELPICADCRVG